MRLRRRETGIDDPAPGLNAGALQIVLQMCGFQNRGGFGQGDDHDFRLRRVLQAHHGCYQFSRGLSRVAHDIAVV